MSASVSVSATPSPITDSNILIYRGTNPTPVTPTYSGVPLEADIRSRPGLWGDKLWFYSLTAGAWKRATLDLALLDAGTAACVTAVYTSTKHLDPGAAYPVSTDECVFVTIDRGGYKVSAFVNYTTVDCPARLFNPTVASSASIDAHVSALHLSGAAKMGSEIFFYQSMLNGQAMGLKLTMPSGGEDDGMWSDPFVAIPQDLSEFKVGNVFTENGRVFICGQFIRTDDFASVYKYTLLCWSMDGMTFSMDRRVLCSLAPRRFLCASGGGNIHFSSCMRYFVDSAPYQLIGENADDSSYSLISLSGDPDQAFTVAIEAGAEQSFDDPIIQTGAYGKLEIGVQTETSSPALEWIKYHDVVIDSFSKEIADGMRKAVIVLKPDALWHVGAITHPYYMEFQGREAIADASKDFGNLYAVTGPSGRKTSLMSDFWTPAGQGGFETHEADDIADHYTEDLNVRTSREYPIFGSDATYDVEVYGWSRAGHDSSDPNYVETTPGTSENDKVEVILVIMNEAGAQDTIVSAASQLFSTHDHWPQTWLAAGAREGSLPVIYRIPNPGAGKRLIRIGARLTAPSTGATTFQIERVEMPKITVDPPVGDTTKWTAPKPNYYDWSLGAEISYGAIDPAEDEGVLISGLQPGQAYALESYGSAWYYDGAHTGGDSRRFIVSNDTAPSGLTKPPWYGGAYYDPNTEETLAMELPVWAAKVEQVDHFDQVPGLRNHRIYFVAGTDHLYVKLACDPHTTTGLVSGSYGWKLSHAVPPPPYGRLKATTEKITLPGIGTPTKVWNGDPSEPEDYNEGYPFQDGNNYPRYGGRHWKKMSVIMRDVDTSGVQWIWYNATQWLDNFGNYYTSLPEVYPGLTWPDTAEAEKWLTQPMIETGGSWDDLEEDFVGLEVLPNPTVGEGTDGGPYFWGPLTAPNGVSGRYTRSQGRGARDYPYATRLSTAAEQRIGTGLTEVVPYIHHEENLYYGARNGGQIGYWHIWEATETSDPVYRGWRVENNHKVYFKGQIRGNAASGDSKLIRVLTHLSDIRGLSSYYVNWQMDHSPTLEEQFDRIFYQYKIRVMNAPANPSDLKFTIKFGGIEMNLVHPDNPLHAHSWRPNAKMDLLTAVNDLAGHGHIDYYPAQYLGTQWMWLWQDNDINPSNGWAHTAYPSIDDSCLVAEIICEKTGGAQELVGIEFEVTFSHYPFVVSDGLYIPGTTYEWTAWQYIPGITPPLEDVVTNLTTKRKGSSELLFSTTPYSAWNFDVTTRWRTIGSYCKVGNVGLATDGYNFIYAYLRKDYIGLSMCRYGTFTNIAEYGLGYGSVDWSSVWEQGDEFYLRFSHRDGKMFIEAWPSGEAQPTQGSMLSVEWDGDTLGPIALDDDLFHVGTYTVIDPPSFRTTGFEDSSRVIPMLPSAIDTDGVAGWDSFPASGTVDINGLLYTYTGKVTAADPIRGPFEVRGFNEWGTHDNPSDGYGPYPDKAVDITIFDWRDDTTAHDDLEDFLLGTDDGYGIEIGLTEWRAWTEAASKILYMRNRARLYAKDAEWHSFRYSGNQKAWITNGLTDVHLLTAGIEDEGSGAVITTTNRLKNSHAEGSYVYLDGNDTITLLSFVAVSGEVDQDVAYLIRKVASIAGTNANFPSDVAVASHAFADGEELIVQ